jgi:hypothetical protein
MGCRRCNEARESRKCDWSICKRKGSEEGRTGDVHAHSRWRQAVNAKHRFVPWKTFSPGQLEMVPVVVVENDVPVSGRNYHGAARDGMEQSQP